MPEVSKAFQVSVTRLQPNTLTVTVLCTDGNVISETFDDFLQAADFIEAKMANLACIDAKS